jgi:glycosyltransferase involved in cell wall biosynthesis
MALRVLMLGWELPPFNSGGLGVACLGLARSLVNHGVNVTFVLPQKQDFNIDFLDLVFADINLNEALAKSYTTSSLHFDEIHLDNPPSDFVSAALLFGKRVGEIIKKYSPDIIHAHDWLTFPAGIASKKVSGKPLVSHVHSTEIDRTGGHFPNPQVYEIEKKGLEYSNRIVSVSNFTKNLIITNYGINHDKINVVHNGCDVTTHTQLPPALSVLKEKGYKIVLYLGRITLQKGPEYFIRAAKKVSEYNPKTIFVVAGSGDMQDRMIFEASSLGITDKVMFTGFLRGDEKNMIYQAADVYVMPSVSEPFGITPLEAIANGTPVLVSKQSGVSEVLNNVLKVDFWDIDDMADKILAVLKHKSLTSDLKKESSKELPNINWEKAAEKCIGIYNQLL